MEVVVILPAEEEIHFQEGGTVILAQEEAVTHQGEVEILQVEVETLFQAVDTSLTTFLHSL